MRLHCAFGIILGVCSLSLFGQISWNTTNAKTSNESYSTILPTVDGNFLCGGKIFPDNGGYADILLVKIKPNGDLLWRKTYSGIKCEYLQTIFPTADGNYMLVGKGLPGIWITKIKPNGDRLWTKTYGVTYDPELLNILSATNGNFLLGGSADKEQNILLIKINSNGDTLWTRTYREKNNNTLSTIIPTVDGNFMMVGSTGSWNEGILNGFVLKINPEGDTLWTRTFGSTPHNSLRTILPTNDSNFLIGGITPNGLIHNDNNDITYVTWLIKINLNGDTLWTKTFEEFNGGCFQSLFPTKDDNYMLLGNDGGNYLIWLMNMNQNGKILCNKIVTGFKEVEFMKMIPTIDGNFLLGFNITSRGRDVLLMKITPNGDTLWTTTLGGTNDDYLSTILPISNDDFMLSGSTYSSSSGNQNYWLKYFVGDKYTRKDSNFIYKIPLFGPDSLNFLYVPLKVPSGMTISPGGTVSWTPQTDSTWMQQVKYVVENDAGQKDTVAFNIFVNSDYHAPVAINPSRITKNRSTPFEIISNSSGNKITFILPYSNSNLYIYDVTGKIVDRVVPVISNTGVQAVWNGTTSGGSKIPTGKYFAKVSDGKQCFVKPLLFVR